MLFWCCWYVNAEFGPKRKTTKKELQTQKNKIEAAIALGENHLPHLNCKQVRFFFCSEGRRWSFFSSS